MPQAALLPEAGQLIPIRVQTHGAQQRGLPEPPPGKPVCLPPCPPPLARAVVPAAIVAPSAPGLLQQERNQHVDLIGHDPPLLDFHPLVLDPRALHMA
jgi:hypothetical protein